jgi:hypothetical protein
VKVFLSQAGPVSHELAKELKSWLKKVIQAVDPWISSEDIDSGARWSPEIAKALDANSFGILCMTPSNLTAPWIMFEAGALSKAADGSRVVPYLLNLELSDLKQPLGQFQARKADRGDTLKLVETLNNSVEKEHRLDGADLNDIFDKWWPDLEKRITAIAQIPEAPAKPRPTDELVQEMLTAVRELDRRVGAMQDQLTPRGVVSTAPGIIGPPGTRYVTVSDDFQPVYWNTALMTPGLNRAFDRIVVGEAVRGTHLTDDDVRIEKADLSGKEQTPRSDSPPPAPSSASAPARSPSKRGRGKPPI